MVHDGARTRRLSRDRDTIWVAAELGDMLLHPHKGKLLIQKAGIELALLLDGFGGKEPEGTQPVLYLDNNEAIAVGIHPHTWVVRSPE